MTGRDFPCPFSISGEAPRVQGADEDQMWDMRSFKGVNPGESCKKHH
jgi:hypothetical protein